MSRDNAVTILPYGACPRDGSRLRADDRGYPSCIQCGFEDYTYVQPKRRRHGGLMNGLVAQLRYIGFATALMDLTLSVRAERDLSQLGIATIPSCPWDTKDMKAVPKNNYGKNKGERTYKCGRRHKIILYSSTNGEWRGWT
jgi:hypothetical protein